MRKLSKSVILALSIVVLLSAFNFNRVANAVDIEPTTPTITSPGSTMSPSAVNRSYQTTIQVSGGLAPYTFDISTGNLPPGLSLNPTTGQISGTTITAGTFNFTLRVTDANSVTGILDTVLTVASEWPSLVYTRTPLGSPVISPVTLRLQGVFGLDLCPTVTDVAYQILIHGGPFIQDIPHNSFVYHTQGELIDDSFGVNLAPGTYSIELYCYNPSQANHFIDFLGLEGSFTVVPESPTIIYPTSTMPPSAVNRSYQTTIQATGGLAPYTFDVSVGNLPQGLSLDQSTGVISGIPTIAGSFNFTLRVTDANSNTGTLDTVLTVAPEWPGLVFTRTPLDNPATSPLTLRLQGVFGLDLCPTLTDVAYQVLIHGGPVTLDIPHNSFVYHTQGELIDDSFGVNLSPGSYSIELYCYNPSQANHFIDFLGLGSVNIVPEAPTIISPGSIMPPSAINRSYQATIQATGGLAPYTFNIGAGNLPPGLSLNPTTGQISGTPTTAGSFSFTLQVIDSNSSIGTLDTVLTVAPEWPGLVYTRTPSGSPTTSPLTLRLQGVFGLDFCPTVNDVAYQILIHGGPFIKDVPHNSFVYHTQGELIDDSFGVDLSPGSYYIELYCYNPAQANHFIDFLGLEGVGVSSILVSTSNLADSTVGVAYTQTLQASGGTHPLNWNIMIGSLPNGLSLNSSTGEISGIATTAGSYDFTVQVTDANSNTATQDLTIVVNPAPEITTASLPDATLTANYSQSLDVTGGTDPLTWSVSAGSLPPGLTLSSSSGVLSGEPTETGTFNFTIQVTDANGAFDVQDLTLTVNDVPSITTTTLPAGTISAVYSQMLLVSGGSNPFTWSVISGTLPDGLNLNTNTGEIFGTPTTQGNYSFTVQVSDNNSVSDTQALSLTINPAVSITMNSNLPDADVNVSYSQTLSATGGTAPLTWTILSGSLPSSLNLSTSGLLSGTPTITGTFNFTVQATDANNQSATQALSLVVNPSPTITTTTLQDATANFAYSQALQASGGTTPLTWNLLSGTLPPGLSVGSSGIISGTPTTPGGYTFTVQVSDAYNQTSNQVLSIHVHPALHVTTSNLPNGKVGKNYSHSVHAGGGTDPLVWSIVSGSLPNGLSLDSSSGTISGVPTTTGTSNFTVGVQDANGASSTQALSITVN